MLKFDPKTGIAAEDAFTTREKVAQDWRNAFHKDGAPTLRTSPETPAGQLIDAETALVQEKDADILKVANMVDPEKSDGVWQEAFVKWFGLRKKHALPSTVDVVCRGLPNTIIPKQSIVETTAGDQFMSTKRATIGKDGTVTVRFIAAENGATEIPRNSVKKIITYVPGWDTVVNPREGVLGRNEETREELENRRQLLMQANSRGNIPAMYSRLFQLDGVYYVKIQENDTDYPQPWKVGNVHNEDDVSIIVPPHSVVIIVYGGEDDEIAEAIYRTKSSGCGTFGTEKVTFTDPDFYNTKYTYLILRPVPLDFDVEVTLSTWDGMNIGDGTALIEQVVNATWNHYYQNNYGQNTVDAAVFYCPIQNAGVKHLYQIRIAAPDANTGWQQMIQTPAIYRPTLGNVIVKTK